MARSKLDDKANSISLVKHNQVLSELKKELDESGKAHISVKKELSKVADTLGSTQKMLQLVIAERDVAKMTQETGTKNRGFGYSVCKGERGAVIPDGRFAERFLRSCKKNGSRPANQLVQLNTQRDDLAKPRRSRARD